MQLLGDSWSIFKDLKLEDWVKHAMGMPSAAIGLFESYHNELGLSLFCFLQQFPSDIDIFWEATKSVQQNDPFLYRTLSRALTAFENKRPYHKLPIEAGLIVGPLKVLLARPDKAIIRRLKVLEARYTRYKVGPDMASGRAFEPTTEFFTVLSKQSAPTIAWKMTQDVLQGFGKITLDGLVSHNGHLRDLAVQWDELSHNVEEVAVAGGQEDKLRDIARELYNLRNHFCLCAVLSGMVQGRLQIESAFTGFVNDNGNYRQYRRQLHTVPSLPFLYPFIIDLRRGNHEAVRDIFSFILYEQFSRRIKEETVPRVD
ncbi:unnamed protein product [Penicillium camemberti]|uniref:Str. FM013 n=1 Tax=Penicillium camemberti (strain FM 013) TaxID=1429867 RepID=A0A0G4PV55_PENC3|nr:unnamed protein product [Penicillium camemberti]